MSAPVSSVWTDAEALFTHTLQPALDIAATADASGVSAGWIVGGAVGAGLVGLVGCRCCQDLDRPIQDAPTSRFSSSPFFPVPMTRFLLLAALLIAAPAFAQTHAEAMAQLAPYEGTYTISGEPHQDEGAFDGSLTIAPVLGGRFQQWDWTMFMRGDGVSEEVALRFMVGYDSVTNVYTVHRFDSRDVDSPTVTASALDSSKGRLQVDGNTLVMAWTMMSPEDPSQAGTFRNRVRITSDGLHVDTEASPDDGSPVVAVATTRAARR